MKASIDCGTNSFRLLVVDDYLRPVARQLIITRLGEGVHDNRVLAPTAIDRSLDALRQFKSVLDDYGVTDVRAVATSAARDANNGKQFLEPARSILGMPVEILSGEQEGTLTYAGVTAGAKVAGPTLVVDIGGGSTELAYGDGGQLERALSLDAGCVRVTELFLHSDPYSPGELDEARSFVRELVASVTLQIPPSTALVGVAGSTTSLAAIFHGVVEWQHGCVDGTSFSRVQLDALCTRLAQMTNEERLGIPALPPGRADVIVAGAVILGSVMDRFALDRCTISESDLLLGLLLPG